MMIMHPDATIPLVQVSLVSNLDPAAHLALGRALSPLRDEGVLILGSGLSYHNMQGFWRKHPRSAPFDAWLTDAVASADSKVRDAKLKAWREAPDALYCHPREEHLLPLMVVAGAAGTDQGTKAFSGKANEADYSAFHFGT